MTEVRTELAFEDFTAGRVFDLGTIEIDRDEMIAFAAQYDPQPVHLDDAAAARNPLVGKLCASSLFVAALWSRAFAEQVLNRSTALGSPGGNNVSWPAPVFPGDQLTVRSGVLSSRLSKGQPGVGLVDVLATLHRDDQCVYRAQFALLLGTH